MEKTLTKLGNSWALVLDKVLMELVGIEPDVPVKLAVRGDELIIRAAKASPKLLRKVDSAEPGTSADVSAGENGTQVFLPVSALDFDEAAISVTSSPKKRAFLIGDEPKSKNVHTLLKMALYRGESINGYDLINGKHKFQWNNVKGDPKKSQFRDYWILNGHEIDHPNDIPFADAQRWIQHGRRAAKSKRLEIG